MKLYLDEHLPPILVTMLQERGIDCLTTQTAGNLGQSDEAQLTFSTINGRVLVTFNCKDFLILVQRWTPQQSHGGLILSKQRPASELLRQILHLNHRHNLENLTNHVLWLQNYKDSPIP